MDTTEIRNIAPAAILAEIDKTRAALWKMRFQAKGEPLENSGQVRQLKKTIARLLTVLREKTIAAEQAGASRRPPEVHEDRGG
jgi:large subunit ribosomal protein L29